MSTIFIAGGTGFVGTYLLNSLKGTEYHVRCLVRGKEKADRVRSQGFEAVQGDITDVDSLRGALEGVDTVVHLVGIIREQGPVTFDSVHVQGTLNLVNESLASGVKGFFYQSALGADEKSPFKYCRTKARAEEVVTASGITYTIFRPSLIVGKGDGFTERMKQLLSAGPVVPVPGRGRARFQPLYINDWVRCFHAVLDGKGFGNHVFELGGPEQLTYIEILEQMMKALRMEKRIVHLPMGVMRLSLPFMGVARLLASAAGRQIPEVTSELLSLMDQDNICEPDAVEKNFGFRPKRFAEALREFIE